MKPLTKNVFLINTSALIILLVIIAGCQQQSNNSNDQVEANIKMYTNVWDEILNKGNIDMIDTHFASNYVNKTV